MSNASNLSTLANVLDDGTSGQFLKSTGSGGVAFDTVAAGAVVYATADLLPLSGNSAGDMAYVTATNRFYINNGSGWYSVSLVNTNPNITSVQDAGSNTTPFTLATDGTATVITVTAADPEEVPLTYGYSVTSGSLNGSTVTQGTGSNTNVFTVTPHASQEATFTITFTASDGINQATSANAFSLTFITIVTDSNHTTLLATATGTSDNDNITYIDGSGNSQNFTVTGSVTAGTFSPYRSGGYSTYFDGSSDNLSLTANSGFSLDSNFTIECWFNPSSITLDSQHPSILKIGTTQLYLNSSNNYVGFFHSTNDVVKSSNSSITENQWYHVSVTRSGSVLTLFLDGVSVNTVNNSTGTFGASSGSVDIGTYSGTGGDFHGYISDFRIVKGTAITPPSGGPTGRLEAVTNTSLLTCHLPYIADGSTNSHSITINGNVSIKPFSPYDYPEYSAADYGGSVYFDASNYATISNFNQSITGNFTVECWVYVTGSNAGDDTFLKWGNLRFRSNNDSAVRGVANIGGFMSFGSGNTHTPNRWVHVVLDRSGNTLKAYKNGINFYHNTNYTASQVGHSGDLYLGWDGSSERFIGYISDLRIVSESLYGSYGTSTSAANFNLPTAPLASNSNAILHFKGTDASIIDKSQGANLKLVDNTTGSTAQVKFSNTKSMYFDGTGDYILSQEPVKLGTQDFTVECWLYYQSGLELMGNRTASDSGGFSVRITSTSLTVGNSSGTGFGSVFSGTTSSLTNAWHHIAVSRSSGVTKIYVDGTSIASHSNSINFSLSNPFALGYAYTNGSGAASIQGYIQDFRVTIGKPRYTANFTPPSAPLEG